MDLAVPKRIVLLVGVLSILAAACGGSGENTAPGAANDAGGESASLNDADVEFLQQMIPHHEQATEMAELVGDRTDRTELVDFAEKIIADQSKEIDQMRSLLSDAGAEEEGGGMEGMEGMEGMPGQMDESEMKELEGLKGDEFDLAFIDMMTRHHEGAIEMAEKVTDEGENPEVAQLAATIIKAQRAEIEQMASWKEEWAG